MPVRPREVDHPAEQEWRKLPVHAVRTTRYLRWLFVCTVGAAVLLPSLVLLGVPDAPQHGWSTSAGDVLWLTALFAPGPAVLGWYGNHAIKRAERGVQGWPAPPVLGGAAIGALILSTLQLVDGVTDPTSGIIMAIPGMLLAIQVVGALAGAVIAAVAQKLLAGSGASPRR
jgi:hypothetical protein